MCTISGAYSFEIDSQLIPLAKSCARQIVIAYFRAHCKINSTICRKYLKNWNTVDYIDLKFKSIRLYLIIIIIFISIAKCKI